MEQQAPERRPLSERLSLAVQHHGAGRLEEAERLYREVLDADPRNVDVLCNLGHVLLCRGMLEESVATYERALAIRPDCADALTGRGNAWQAAGKLDAAVESYRQALATDPAFVDALANLGIVLSLLGRPQEAVPLYERVLALKPDMVEVLMHLAIALREQGKPAAAVPYAQRATTLRPDSAMAHACLAVVLQDVGRSAQASEAAETALRLAPGQAMLYSVLAENRRFRPDEPHIAAMERLLQSPALSAQDSVLLHFALAKAYTDTGEPARAFRNMSTGNELKRRQIAYDEERELGALRRIETIFTRALMTAKSGLGDPSPLPVFIVGMPRSGTTLLEQILASHPKVFGAGEIEDFAAAVTAVPVPAGAQPDYPEVVAKLGAAELKRLGSDYVARIRRRAPSAERIVNKLPANFQFVGLIKLALPNARIIHIERDPVDTCFSCYSKLFEKGHGYSFDLRELGRYYKAYARLMAHWREILPAGAMLEVRYEELVADLETQARRIVDYCGLDWDPACLAFHRTDRPVQTPSALQVRQPIYDSSIGRSREYLPLLQPLLDELT